MLDAIVAGAAPAEAEVIDPVVLRLHELAWRPGAHMQQDWWAHLSIAPWKTDYQLHPGLRRALDALIVQRRGFPLGPLPASLSPDQVRLMGLERRLPTLLPAIGLFAVGSPELLLLGRYRRQLARMLGEHACDQLAALIPSTRGAMIPIEPEALPELAYAYGRQWLDSALQTCVGWQAISVCVAPPRHDVVPLTNYPSCSALQVLFKLERLL
jgi:hypothetical protein